ncbi:MAG: hypothetical protein O3B65_02235 [Chloroflexi bacterium]|nr:hypothetical protein [Chloroflexota bacterium]
MGGAVTRRHRLASLASLTLLLLAACGQEPPPTPQPTPTAVPAPTSAATPHVAPPATPTAFSDPVGFALRQRAGAFAKARTEARFDDAYAFTLPAFKEVCDADDWLYGLIGEASFVRGINSLHDDYPLAWRVRLVEVLGDVGTVAVSVSTDTGRGLDVYTRKWTLVDSEWWFDEPPDSVCY